MADILSDAKPENHFITKDGQRIKNIYQLQKSLLNMNDEVFSHHVNSERNDFYNWARDIYNNEQLSSAILNCRTKEELSQNLKEKLDTAIKHKKEQDMRRILEEAKKESEEKKKAQEEAAEREEKIERKALPKKETRITAEREEPAKKEIKPRKEEHVFVNKPPRQFTKEERPISINSATYMKANVIDFVFGIIIGIIAILIIKQLI